MSDVQSSQTLYFNATYMIAIIFLQLLISCERFEPRSHFKSSLSLIVRVNEVLNRTVVDSD